MKKPSSTPKSARPARPATMPQAVLPGPSAQTATSDRILMAAAHLFATHGFAHTSMPAIAKASGITPGAIYRHFDSKAQLLVEVVRYALQTLPTSVRLLEPAQLDAADLPEFAASYTTPGYKLIRQLALEIHAAGSRGADAMTLLSKVNEEAARVISRSISTAQDGDLLDRNLNPDFAAIFLQVTIMGLAHLDTLRPDLIGNQSWHDFVLDRVSAILGLRDPARTKSDCDPDSQSADCAAPDAD